MYLLVTGANGFIGKNLCVSLGERSDTVLKADIDTTFEELQTMALQADFVIHLAGVNRPKDDADYQKGNADFTQTLLQLLEKGKKPPVLISSSTQALMDNPYGKSKLAAEKAVFTYAGVTGAKVFLYRLTNAFGKWSKPNYNSVVATFCYNIARDLPITISDPEHTINLVYIDDIVDAFLSAVDGQAEPGEDGFYHVQPEKTIALGELAALLHRFHSARSTLEIPNQSDAFVRKLYATYQSYLPESEFAYQPISHADERGFFMELFHMNGMGQISVNVQKPHITKGEHWHHTKHEKFIVVAGTGVIRFRKITGDQVLSYSVDGKTPTVVEIPPGYTHNIENLGDTDMVTIMWANEVFDPQHPDTFRMPV